MCIIDFNYAFSTIVYNMQKQYHARDPCNTQLQIFAKIKWLATTGSKFAPTKILGSILVYTLRPIQSVLSRLLRKYY